MNEIFKVIIQKIRSKYSEKLGQNSLYKTTGLADFGLSCILAINSFISIVFFQLNLFENFIK